MAWHGLTKVIDPATPITCENSGIGYEMKTIDIKYEGMPVEYKGHKYIISTDDMLPIGNPVGRDYVVVSNCRMFELVGEALKERKYSIESVGSVGNRQKCFMSAQLDEPMNIAGDKTQTELQIIWGHGGIVGWIAKSGITRMVCENTIKMALAETGDFELAGKHTVESVKKLDKLGNAIDRHYAVIDLYKVNIERIALEVCNEDKARAIFAGFLFRDNEIPKEFKTARNQNTVETLLGLYKDTKQGNEGKTLKDVLNALTDYYTHESSGGEDKWKQFESSEFGIAAQRKIEAYEILMGKSVRGLGKNLAEVVARGRKVIKTPVRE